MSKRKNIIIAITGASGSIYALRLMQKLEQIKEQWNKVAVIPSKNAVGIWKEEIGKPALDSFNFDYYEPGNFYAPFASGSSSYSTLLVVPCSMGTLGRIAHGTSDDLIIRAADVMLKERRKLILLPRENPFNLIHLNAMKTLTAAGAIVCNSSPSFYSRPQNLTEAVDTVVDRMLDLASFEIDTFRWKE